MSREIKFRAWNKFKGLMYDPMPIIDFKIMEINAVVLMQFTGLKDKNGKDIYEGDVIKTSYGKVGTVVYYQRSASFIVNDPAHFNEQLWYDAIHSEIIGNIYENPQLLSSEQKAQASVATDDDSNSIAG